VTKLKRNRLLRILSDNHIKKDSILFYDYFALSSNLNRTIKDMDKVISCKDILKGSVSFFEAVEVSVNEYVLERINEIKKGFDYFDYDNEEDLIVYLEHSQFIALFLDSENVDLYYKENVIC